MELVLKNPTTTTTTAAAAGTSTSTPLPPPAQPWKASLPANGPGRRQRNPRSPPRTYVAPSPPGRTSNPPEAAGGSTTGPACAVLFGPNRFEGQPFFSAICLGGRLLWFTHSRKKRPDAVCAFWVGPTLGERHSPLRRQVIGLLSDLKAALVLFFPRLQKAWGNSRPRMPGAL